MLYYNFKDYREFNEIFGINKHGNGAASRKNALLLSFLKNPKLLRDNERELYTITSTETLKDALIKRISEEMQSESCGHCIELKSRTFWSRKYSTDNYKGVCEDGDSKSIRYYNHGKGKTYKMKAGKFYQSIFTETQFGKDLQPNVMNWLCEELSREWQTYAFSLIPKNTLHVNDDFHRIYSSRYLNGDFKSCMVDRNRTSFYRNAVKAKAAYLEDGNGKVMARCIIFTDVHDSEGNTWRLAERQYSAKNNLIVQQALVDALIAGNHIDGYKRVGAGCGDANAFLDINGKSLYDKVFSIDCNLETDDTLSYQDSFKWYDYDNNTAYNHECCGHTYELSTTDYSLESSENAEEEYDDYHEYYCESTLLVHYHGGELWCDEDNMDDFIWIENQQGYYHEDDVICCAKCGAYELESESYHSEITEEDYCCEDCMEKHEAEYKESNWFRSEFDNEYYENFSEVTEYEEWNANTQEYKTKTIGWDVLGEKMREGIFTEFDGRYYYTAELDEETGIPYNYKCEEVDYEVA